LDNTDQIAYWNEGPGEKWAANQMRLDRLFAPLSEILIEAAAPKLGEHVLDIGCGCGDISLASAARIGANGHVLGADISYPMLERARERAGQLVAGQQAAIDWLKADAMVHHFEPTADLLISRFGVMFFADPRAAFANLRRGLKAGGRFAFLCWRPRASVEWMQWPLDQVSSLLPIPPVTTGEPGPFGLADEVSTIGLLTGAGFADVRADPVEATLVLGEGRDPVADALELLLETGPLGRLIREAEPDVRAQAEPLLRRALEAKADTGEVRLRGACWLYRGEAR
jgi:SAM-dependent methyltransferase